MPWITPLEPNWGELVSDERWRMRIGTYDVGCDDFGVEVDVQSLADGESNAQTLRLTSEGLLTQRGWDGVGNEDSSCGVEGW